MILAESWPRGIRALLVQILVQLGSCNPLLHLRTPSRQLSGFSITCRGGPCSLCQLDVEDCTQVLSYLAPATALAGPSPTPNRWRRSPPGSRIPARRCLRPTSPAHPPADTPLKPLAEAARSVNLFVPSPRRPSAKASRARQIVTGRSDRRLVGAIIPCKSQPPCFRRLCRKVHVSGRSP